MTEIFWSTYAVFLQARAWRCGISGKRPIRSAWIPIIQAGGFQSRPFTQAPMWRSGQRSLRVMWPGEPGRRWNWQFLPSVLTTILCWISPWMNLCLRTCRGSLSGRRRTSHWSAGWLTPDTMRKIKRQWTSAFPGAFWYFCGKYLPRINTSLILRNMRIILCSCVSSWIRLWWNTVSGRAVRLSFII